MHPTRFNRFKRQRRHATTSGKDVELDNYVQKRPLIKSSQQNEVASSTSNTLCPTNETSSLSITIIYDLTYCAPAMYHASIGEMEDKLVDTDEDHQKNATLNHHLSLS